MQKTVGDIFTASLQLYSGKDNIHNFRRILKVFENAYQKMDKELPNDPEPVNVNDIDGSINKYYNIVMEREALLLEYYNQGIIDSIRSN